MFMERNFFEEKIMKGEYIRYNGHNERNVLKPYGQKANYMKNVKTGELHVTAPKKMVIKVGGIINATTGALVQPPKRRMFKDAILFDGTEKSAKAVFKAFRKQTPKGVKLTQELFRRKDNKIVLVIDSGCDEPYKLTIEENFYLCIDAKSGMAILHYDRLEAHYRRIPKFSIAGIAAMFGIFR